MKQIEISKWLKGITLVVGLMGLLFFALIVPSFALTTTRTYPEIRYLFWPVLIYLLGMAILCYFVLFLFWGVCTEIGKDNSFSKENATAFVKISKMTMVMAVYWFLGLVALALLNEMHFGAILFLIIAVILSIAVAILSGALSHLVLKAYEMKEESDLTI